MESLPWMIHARSNIYGVEGSDRNQNGDAELDSIDGS